MGIFNMYQSALVAIILISFLIISVRGQISTPCTLSMITSVTPCVNFITGSTNGNSTSNPSPGCCSSLKSLMSTSMDCACLLVTANIPFQLPTNRTLAFSLPRACNLGGVPVLCKGSASPLPAPGPVPLLLGPSLPPTSSTPLGSSLPPTSSTPLSPLSSKALGMAPTPDYEPEGPTGTSSVRPVLNPSASSPTYSISSFSHIVMLFFAGVVVFKCY